MNDDLDLDRAAGTFDVPPGDVDLVIARAIRRRRRQSRITGALTVVAVVAATVTAIRVADRPAGTTVSSGGGDVQLGDSGIRWERRDVDHPLGSNGEGSMVVAGGQLYAVSSAPGVASTRRQMPPAVYRSEDGIDWSQEDAPTGLDVVLLAADGDQLYALGTAPGTARTTNGGVIPQAAIGHREPDGRWEDAELPIDLAAVAEVSRTLTVHAADLAAGPKGIVAVVDVFVEPDVEKLIPGFDAPNGYAVTLDGVDVLGDENPCPSMPMTPVVSKNELGANQRVDEVLCREGETEHELEPSDALGVLRHYGWAELGVHGDALAAMMRQPFVFHAAGEGAPFGRVEGVLSGTLATRNVFVQADDDGFDLVAVNVAVNVGGGSVGSRSDLVARRSEDGTRWSAADGVPTIGGVASVGRLDGQLAVVGSTVEGAPLLARLGPGGWVTSSLESILDRGVYLGNAAIGPLGVVMVAYAAPVEGRARWTLLTSRDGNTWSKDEVDDLVDGEEAAQVLRVTITDDRAVVAVVLPKERGDRYMPQVALVGTPR